MHRASRFIGLLAAVATSIPSSAPAEEAPRAGQAQADVDADGRPEVVELRRSGDRHVLVLDGRATEHSIASSLVGPGSGELRPLDLGGGHRAAHYRLPLTNERLAFEAVLSVGRGGAVTVAWAGVTGLRGDPGSRWGDRVIVDDIDGNGHPDVLVASVAEEVPLCGTTDPELFPRALDPSTGQIRPVLLNRLRRLQAPEVPIVASRSNPGTLGATPTLDVASFAIASTIAGDRGVVEGLAAPQALDDGDRSTSWVEGRPGPGRGEFVTARLLPGPYRVQALAVTLAPAGQPAGAAFGRLRTFTVILDGEGGVRRFLVTVPDDPAGFAGEPVWVRLPEPIEASCLSLVMGDVFTGPRGAAPPASTAIAEVEIFTDLDFEGGAERLITELGGDSADVEVALRALGARAVPLLQASWPSLDATARRRATRVLAALDDPAAAPLLVDAALGVDPRAAEEARTGLRTLGARALPALRPELEASDAARRARAAQSIGEIGTVEATEVLARRIAGPPPAQEPDLPSLQRALVRALERSGPEGRQQALECADAAGLRGRQVLLAALGPATPAEQDRYVRLLTESWQQATSFEDRYRLISVAASVGPRSELLELIQGVLRGDQDRYLRARAAEMLGRLAGADGAPAAIVEALVAAANDQWTGVRLAVAGALGSADPAAARPALSELLADPWPVVRAAAATSVARAGAEGGALPVIVAALDDRSPAVQANAARLLGELGSPEALAPLRAFAESDERPVEARAAAARAIGALCSTDAEAALLALLDDGRDGRASPAETRVAAAAAGALARFGSAEAARHLVTAARGGPPGLRLAAVEALGQGDHPGAREALQALTEDPMPPLRAAAAAALRHLEDAAEGGARCPR